MEGICFTGRVQIKWIGQLVKRGSEPYTVIEGWEEMAEAVEKYKYKAIPQDKKVPQEIPSRLGGKRKADNEPPSPAPPLPAKRPRAGAKK